MVKLDKIRDINIAEGTYDISARCHIAYTNDKLAKAL